MSLIIIIICFVPNLPETIYCKYLLVTPCKPLHFNQIFYLENRITILAIRNVFGYQLIIRHFKYTTGFPQKMSPCSNNNGTTCSLLEVPLYAIVKKFILFPITAGITLTALAKVASFISPTIAVFSASLEIWFKFQIHISPSYFGNLPLKGHSDASSDTCLRGSTEKNHLDIYLYLT